MDKWPAGDMTGCKRRWIRAFIKEVIMRDFTMALAHFSSVSNMPTGVWALMLCGVLAAI